MSRGICATSEPVETEAHAWEVAFSYLSRWKIEEQFRFQKTELLIESLRLRDWEPRRKLLLLVTLAYGLLLSLLTPSLCLARARLLLHWVPRADWRQWNAKLPVYRLRWAERPAVARSSSLLHSIRLAALSSPLPSHLAILFSALVDDSVASVRISVLKLCFGS